MNFIEEFCVYKLLQKNNWGKQKFNFFEYLSFVS